jgi:hypothetical protein
MAGPVLSGLILTNFPSLTLKKILIVAVWVLAFAWVQTPALAQHPVGHAGGAHPVGGARSAPVYAPRYAPRPRVMGSRIAAGPRFGSAGLVGAGRRGFGFRASPINVFRRRLFFGVPFFRFGFGVGFNSLWWPTCGPSIGWAWGGGFDCYPLSFNFYGFENYVTLLTYENYAYLYGGDERDLIWLYQRDGRVYGVTDYWFVNGQVHFRMAEDDPTQPAEHVIPYDDLNVQKTIYVNTHRGFRIVFRDEPWQQYLKDHPDVLPPEVPPSQQNQLSKPGAGLVKPDASE